MSENIVLWSCPDCGFGFDAVHEDISGGYSCPLCAELKLEERLNQTHEVVKAMKSIFESWDIKGICNDSLESHEQEVMLELVELCEKLISFKTLNIT